MRSTFIAICCLFFLLGCYNNAHPKSGKSLNNFVGEAAPTSGPPLPQSYRNPVYGWSVSYPDNWTIDAKDPGFIKLQPLMTLPSAFIGIQSAQVHYEALDDFVNFMLSFRKKSFEEKGKTWALISRRSRFLTDGTPAVEFTEEIGPGGKSHSVCTLSDRLAVCMNAETSLNEWGRFDPTFNRIFDSFVAGRKIRPEP